MDRYVGVDAHAESCTLGVLGGSGKRLKSMVVETNGRALVEATRSIPGRVHVCLEEGTQSAWLYELLKPHAEEVVVTVPAESKGAKDDARDAWARADELRTGALQRACTRHRCTWRDCGTRRVRTRWRFRSGRGRRQRRSLAADPGVRPTERREPAASRRHWLQGRLRAIITVCKRSRWSTGRTRAGMSDG